MRYVFGFGLGLLGGVITACALIYFNPLTRGQSLPENDSDWVLGYTLGGAGNWLSTHDRGLKLGVRPPDVPLLWESSIRRSLLVAMPMSAESGGAGAAATRISVPSPATELLRSGILVDDYWLISVPGEGSVFVHSVSNLWPLLRDTVVRVDWLRRDFAGAASFGPTRGPEESGAEVFGLTGRFAGTTGRGRERLTLDDYYGQASLGRLTGELLIEFRNEAP